MAIFVGVEALFILLFVLKSVFSYEARLKRALDKANAWLFKYKKIDANNIKTFNDIVKKGPKRYAYYWQQYILYRDGGPCNYMSEENLIEKPLRTSSWKNNVKNLGIITAVWAVISFVFGLASQYTPQQQYLSFQSMAVALIIPSAVALIGVIALIVIKGKRVLNLDDIYHMYGLFSRFLTNACVDLPPYIDFDLLFTPKEIEKGNAQLREYYEARARKAKEEFERAKNSDQRVVEYHFEDVGVDGTLLLNRAMKESDSYISKKTSIESRMAQVEAQKDALRRNYENVQMDLQRKIQASKENIRKLIEQQAATTSRVEVGLLRQQQEKEANKQDSLQKDYDAEEARYKLQKNELEKEISELRVQLDQSLAEAEKGMSAEYQTFFEKVMKSAYSVAEKQIDAEKKEIIKQRDKNENELINVQTQVKRLLDENITLRAKIDQILNEKEAAGEDIEELSAEIDGHYDEEGNYIYADGSYHDTKGLFHDVDGKIYDMNGVLVGEEEQELDEETKQAMIEQEQIEQFGSYVPTEEVEEVVQAEEEIVEPEETQEVEEESEEVAEEVQEEIVEQPVKVEQPVEEEKVEEQPAKKRGRPKKEKQEEVKEPVKKRGRPKKQTPSEEVKEDKPKRGRPPKKQVEEKKEVQKTTAKRGRPKKEKEVEKKEPAKKRGRPKKEEPKQEMDTLSKINQLISEEEAKLNRMKTLLNSELDQAMGKKEVEKEKDEIMKEVETLKEQAKEVNSDKELSSINKRLEDLIKEIALLNSKK